MRKLLCLTAVSAIGALGLTGIASASSNVPNGTAIAASSGSVALGSLIRCSSTVGGTLTNNGAGAGARGPITSATFSGCTAGTSAAPSTSPPNWRLEINTRSGTSWTGSVTGIGVNIRIGLTNCLYTGSLGATYDNAQRLVLSGTLQTTGSFPCLNNQSVVGTYTVSTPNPLTLS